MDAAIVLSDAQKGSEVEDIRLVKFLVRLTKHLPDLHSTHAAHARTALKSASQLASSQIFRQLWIN